MPLDCMKALLKGCGLSTTSILTLIIPSFTGEGRGGDGLVGWVGEGMGWLVGLGLYPCIVVDNIYSL